MKSHPIMIEGGLWDLDQNFPYYNMLNYSAPLNLSEKLLFAKSALINDLSHPWFDVKLRR